MLLLANINSRVSGVSTSTTLVDPRPRLLRRLLSGTVMPSDLTIPCEIRFDRTIYNFEMNHNSPADLTSLAA